MAMLSVALPLRVRRDGQLERGDAVDQIIHLIKAMAATTPGTWPHAPWFGLHQVFSEANLALDEQQTIADAINVALSNLGVTWARVSRMRTAAALAPGDRRFDLTLLVEGEPVVHGSLAV
jgi:hypothetical protein